MHGLSPRALVCRPVTRIRPASPHPAHSARPLAPGSSAISNPLGPSPRPGVLAWGARFTFAPPHRRLAPCTTRVVAGRPASPRLLHHPSGSSPTRTSPIPLIATREAPGLQRHGYHTLSLPRCWPTPPSLHGPCLRRLGSHTLCPTRSRPPSQSCRHWPHLRTHACLRSSLA